MNSGDRFGVSIVDRILSDLTVPGRFLSILSEASVTVLQSKKFRIEFDDYNAPLEQVREIFRMREKRAKRDEEQTIGILESLDQLRQPNVPRSFEVLSIEADNMGLTFWIEKANIWAVIYREVTTKEIAVTN